MLRLAAALLACTATLALAPSSSLAEPAPAATPAIAPIPGEARPTIVEIPRDRHLAGYLGTTGSFRTDVMLQATIGLELGIRLGRSRFYGRAALDTGIAIDSEFGGSTTEGRGGVEYRACAIGSGICFFAGSDAGLLRYTGDVDEHAFVPFDFGDDSDTTALLLEPRAGLEALGSRISLRVTATERIVRVTESDATWYGGGLNGTLAVRW